MQPLKDMIYYDIMCGIGHIINPNKIPMGIPHCAPTFYNRKLPEISSTNDELFSLCNALIELGSSGGDWHGLIVEENVVDMIVIAVLLKLEHQWWLILGFGWLVIDCS